MQSRNSSDKVRICKNCIFAKLVPRGCLRFVIVVFPDHTHLLFRDGSVRMHVCAFISFFTLEKGRKNRNMNIFQSLLNKVHTEMKTYTLTCNFARAAGSISRVKSGSSSLLTRH